MIINPYIFKVFNLPNAIHEWYIENGSVSGTTFTLPDTGSVGGITLTNPTATQIPTISSINGRKSVLGDGVNDILSHTTTSDFRGADQSGAMHFVFRTPAVVSNNILFSVSKTADITQRFLLLINGTTKFPQLTITSPGNVVSQGITTILPNTNYIFSVYSDGSNSVGYLGTTLQFTTASVLNWFGDITGTTTGVEILSREIGGALYTNSNQGYACYTPFVDLAGVLADQLLIANNFGITV